MQQIARPVSFMMPRTNRDRQTDRQTETERQTRQPTFEAFLKQVLPLSSQVGKKNVDAKKLKASSDEETAARAMLGGDGPSKFLKGKVPILVFVEAWNLDIHVSLILVSVLPLLLLLYYFYFHFPRLGKFAVFGSIARHTRSDCFCSACEAARGKGSRAAALKHSRLLQLIRLFDY